MMGLQFKIDETEIVAYYDEKRIGFVRFEEIDLDGFVFLNCTHISVHIDFQSRRVATDLIKKLAWSQPIGVEGLCIENDYLNKCPQLCNIMKKYDPSVGKVYTRITPFKVGRITYQR